MLFETNYILNVN